MYFKLNLTTWLIICLFLCEGCGGYVTENAYELEEDFSDRTYEYFIPQSYNDSDQLPLYFVFHGFSGTGNQMRQVTLFDYFAEENNFIVIYPDSKGSWNITDTCNQNFDMHCVNDIGYIDYLINEFDLQYNIDRRKIYACGFSHGGCFSHTLSLYSGDQFAAMALVDGGFHNGVQDEDLLSIRKLPILFIFAEGDDICWDENSSDYCTDYDTPIYIQRWAQHNGCVDTPISMYLHEPGIGDIGVLKQTYTDCASNVETILYRIVGGAHEWFMYDEFNTTKTIVEFFQRHPN